MLGENEAGEPDVVLPITTANPMGRAHCLDAVKALLDIGAEAVAQQAFAEKVPILPCNLPVYSAMRRPAGSAIPRKGLGPMPGLTWPYSKLYKKSSVLKYEQRRQT
jgi:hypothetical protein